MIYIKINTKTSQTWLFTFDVDGFENSLSSLHQNLSLYPLILFNQGTACAFIYQGDQKVLAR